MNTAAVTVLEQQPCGHGGAGEEDGYLSGRPGKWRYASCNQSRSSFASETTMPTRPPLAAILFVSAAVVAQSAAEPPRPGVATPGVKIPIAHLPRQAVFTLGGHPDWMAIGDAAWVSNKPMDSVSRLDPATDTVAATIALGAGSQPCSGLTIGFGSVWVPNCGDATISRVDLRTNAITATIHSTIGDTEGSIDAGAGAIWIVIDTKGTLARIDPATNAVAARIQVPSGSYGLAFGVDAVWVTSTDHDVVARVDPRTNRVAATIHVGPRPRFIAADAGAVWTLNQGDGSVTRIDPRSNAVVATIALGVPGHGGDIAVGEGAVWVTMRDFPLTRIDPATNSVVQQFYGSGGDAVRVGLGSVWLTDYDSGTVWRLDPRRVAAVRP